MDNKKIYIMLGIFAIIAFFSGGTLAYLTWQSSESQKTVVNFTVNSNFSCSADGGGNITESDANIVPATCTNTNHSIMRKVKVMPNTSVDISMDLWLDIKALGSGLSNSQNFKYALTTSPTSCDTGVISSGNFNGKTVGDKVMLLQNNYSKTTEETYYLYVWLDKEETSSTTMNQSFNLSLNGSCTNNPYAKSILEEGMIPVTISNDGVATTISKDDNNWYNYDNKQWANAVLVSSTSRGKYLNTSGISITPSDILAYYVWIPRYKYKIWTTSVSATGKEQEIDIVFENKDTPKSNGTKVGEYRTHPAFTFGNTELDGIWVGKFESSGDAITPTILPNVSSLRNQNINTQFTTSLKFAGGTQSGSTVTFVGNDIYGLRKDTNSHMMKNSEWGAVVYLSHSKYGINQEIRINNQNGYMTGCGASAVNGASSATCQIKYGQSASYPQSTTGNITGIFDMSGGAWEHVMGNYNNTPGPSGFTTLPEGKYYDMYSGNQFTGDYSTNMSLCTIGACGGHAAFETAGWYSVYADFADSGTPWISRGGYYGNGTFAGGASSDNNDGVAYERRSWRSVLVKN